MAPQKNYRSARFKKFLERHFFRIYEINRKYATPRYKMTRSVGIILLVLRLYLLFLICILIYKFITLINP